MRQDTATLLPAILPLKGASACTTLAVGKAATADGSNDTVHETTKEQQSYI